MIETRPAASQDAESMAMIHAAAFAFPWDAEVFRTFLEGVGSFAIVTQPLAGFILCRRVAAEAEILTLAIEPRQWRRGLGSTLVKTAADLALEAGAEALFLEVACDNTAARALYAARNFSEVGRRRAYYSRPNGAMDALVLRLDLNR